jgi:hypothetical protein
VFQPSYWATHLNRNQTGGRSVSFLNIDRVAGLSLQIYGAKSLYASGSAPSASPVDVPTATPAPEPSGSPSPC